MDKNRKEASSNKICSHKTDPLPPPLLEFVTRDAQLTTLIAAVAIIVRPP